MLEKPNEMPSKIFAFPGRYIALFLLMVFCFVFFATCENPWMEQAFNLITVKFNSNGGSSVGKQTLFKGETVTRPKNPVKADYQFDGWYQDNGSFVRAWDFNQAAESDMTLYAKWRSKGLELSPASISFGSIQSGFFATWETVNVRNISDQIISGLTVELSGSNPDNFVLNTDDFIGELEPGESTDFMIRPLTNSPIGSYTTTVTVSNDDGISVSANVSFAVTPIPITAVELEIDEPTTGRSPSTPTDITVWGSYSIDALTWSPSHNAFQPDTVYAVSVTLRADDNFTFTGLDNAFVNGSDAVFSNNTGTTVRLSYTFDKTLAKEVTNMDINLNPVLHYTHGQTLNLNQLWVELTYDDNDSDTEIVTFVNFAARNIRVHDENDRTLTNGMILRHNIDHGRTIIVTTGDISAEVGTPLDVAPKALLITGVTHTRQFSNQIPDMEAGVTVNFTGKLDDEEVSIQITGANYTDQNAGTDKTMNISGEALVGEHAGNYYIDTFPNPVPVTGGITKADGITPPAPELSTFSATSITVNEFFVSSNQPIQYAISTIGNGTGLSAWQESPEFINLSAGTTYYVYARSLENENYLMSTTSVSAPITFYTVSFNTYEGTPVPEQRVVPANVTIVEPDPPTRPGYDFDGWYSDAAFTNEWIFGTDIVTSNMTLHARWLGGLSVIFTVDIKDMEEWENIMPPTWDVTPGSTTLEVGAAYQTGYTYQWYLDGASVGTGATYNFNQSQLGVYEIVVVVTRTINGETQSGRCFVRVVR